MKTFLLFFFFSCTVSSQVAFPHNSAPGGSVSSERVSNFTVGDAVNDRLEIANGTQNDGQFIPTLWSYRTTSNTFSLVFTSSIAGSLDNGNSPLMLFTTTIPAQPNFNNTTDFVWGPSGTYSPIVNRPLFQWRNSSQRLMTIIANGNVGIGTETPTAVFNTVGSLRFENLADATGPAYMLGTDAGGNVYEYPVPSGGSGGGTYDFDWLKPDGSVPMSINDAKYTNGFIGFNTQNPTANIHANGTVRFENLTNGATASFMLGTDANGNVSEYPVPAPEFDSDWLKLDNTVPTSINDNIYTNGKVAINTNLIPTRSGTEDVTAYSLFVKGGMLTEEVRVSLESEWADYVFKKGYKLQTLNEVEQHIREKGHLKNMPTADEVRNNGIELGEMNRLLLEKIEELTLYILDVNKKVENQELEIKRLKRKL